MGSPVARGGATGPPAVPVGGAQWSPEGGATGPPCRPLGGATGPIAFFFVQGPRCEFEKKITLRAYRPMGGDQGVFLKFFKMDIYF